MPLEEEERRKFVAEVWKRYEEVQNWAIANWPDAEHRLSTSDFVEGRKEILGLGLPPEQKLKQEPQRSGDPAAPEPEDGGPQYLDVTPAPWP